MADNDQNRRLSEEGVREELQRRPRILGRLAENAFTVAESLRDNYFKNTAGFISRLRRAANLADSGQRDEPIIEIASVAETSWGDLQDELVTFLDGGVGEVEFSNQVPIMLRVGSYAVRTGERDMAEREQFGYYPVILGDLEGGSKERKDFIDIVRITAELLGGLSALKREPDLRLLMFHGPLVYLVGGYQGHAPFTEHDIDLFLQNYADDSEMAQGLKTRFLEEAKLDIYPHMAPDLVNEMADRRLFDPLAWMAFLYRELVAEARERTPSPIIAGVVERGSSREFIEKVLLARVFRGMMQKGQQGYFNDLYGRTDLTSPKNLLDRLRYTDTLLLAMLLEPGQFSEPWTIDKYGGLRRGNVTFPGDGTQYTMDWSALKPANGMGFPQVRACYVSATERTEPMRVEVFADLDGDQMQEAVRRIYLYSQLLPEYGFPVGLDVVDKYAKVPNWLTDAEMRRILVQAIYMTHRDWIFRPDA